MIEIKIPEGEFRGFTPYEAHYGEDWVVGTWQHKENRICVSHANCDGTFKHFAEALVKRFKTKRFIIYNVLSDKWNLKGFDTGCMLDPVFNEPVIYYVGEWQIPQKDQKAI